MLTTQDKLNNDVKEYAGYMRMIKETSDRIDSEARELLCELQEIDGWECMILHCYAHYLSYRHKDSFFRSCSVAHTDNSVQFIKGYSDGEAYVVLDISFKKSLQQQVRERMEGIEFEKRQKEIDEREKDLAILERIRKKFETTVK